MDCEPIPIAQAVATVQRVAAYNRIPDVLPARPPVAEIDDALMIVSQAIGLDERAETALDDLIKHLDAHSNVTWALARWWDVNTGPMTAQFSTMYTRRWLAVMDALRAALEL